MNCVITLVTLMLMWYVLKRAGGLQKCSANIFIISFTVCLLVLFSLFYSGHPAGHSPIFRSDSAIVFLHFMPPFSLPSLWSFRHVWLICSDDTGAVWVCVSSFILVFASFGHVGWKWNVNLIIFNTLWKDLLWIFFISDIKLKCFFRSTVINTSPSSKPRPSHDQVQTHCVTTHLQ